jgi:demethylmenaquinone methyltransferase / 2-methoxy-6-polyprenyl-1,4-benzoquinol methylase
MSTARTRDVAALFDRNAARYDRVNTVISFGQDATWRRHTAAGALAAAAAVGGPGALRILDACGGTGRLALELACGGADVTMADASPGMLAVATARAQRMGVALRTVRADLAAEPAAELPGAPFAAATIAFGLRYMEHPAGLLRSLADALVPGGVVAVLEFVVPPRGVLSAIGSAYFFGVLPRVATLLAGRAELYRELSATTHALGASTDLLRVVGDAGLRPLAMRAFAQGLVVNIVAARASGRLTASGA